MHQQNRTTLPHLPVSLTGLLAVAVGLSYAGRWYWLFELCSHFVVQYVLAALVLGVILLRQRRFRWSVVAFVIGASQFYQLAPFLLAKTPGENAQYDTIRLLQYNVNRNNLNVEEMANWVLTQTADTDVMVLLEVTDKWQGAIEVIEQRYPHYVVKDMRGGRQMVVMSRLPVETEVKYLGDAEAPVIVLRGQTLGHKLPFVLYGLHPPPPVMPSYTKRRDDLLRAAGREIATEASPYKVLVGDLNTTRFSSVFKELTALSGLGDGNDWLGAASLLQSSWPSLVPQGLGITIDNMLISDGIEVEKKEIMPALGSDHRPVISTLRLVVWGE